MSKISGQNIPKNERERRTALLWDIVGEFFCSQLLDSFSALW